MNRREIDHAIQRSFDGTLEEAECLELRNELKSDPAVRTIYYEYVGLEQALIFRLSRSGTLNAAKSLSEARLRVPRRRSARVAMFAAAALIVLIAITMKAIFVPEVPPIATLRCASGSLFTMTNLDPSSELGVVEMDEDSRVYLFHGTLELEFSSDSRAIVQAPASFHVLSDQRMLIHHGTAWFHISKEGHGFQVTTPEMVVTDLGTEFGIYLSPHFEDEVHVFSGRVIARNLNATLSKETLTTGQARSCDPVGRLKPLPARPADFLTVLPTGPDAELITNGDFEAGERPSNQIYGEIATAESLPFWSVGANLAVALNNQIGRPGYGNDQRTIVSSSADVQVAFQDDTNGQPIPEDVSIRQRFTTVPGVLYSLEFEMGAIIFNRYPLEVTASIYDGPESGRLLKQLVEADRQRKATVTTIRFASLLSRLRPRLRSSSRKPAPIPLMPIPASTIFRFVQFAEHMLSGWKVYALPFQPYPLRFW